MAPPEPSTLEHLGHLNLIEFCRESARWSGRHGAISETSGMVLFQTGTDIPVLCNGALRLDPTVPAAGLVAAADAWFDERERGFTIWARSDCDDDLATASEEAGLRSFFSTPEMVCAEPVPSPGMPSGATLHWVTDARGMADFATVNDAAYADMGLPKGTVSSIAAESSRFLAPHVQTVVAHLDGSPVAAAQAILSHGIAGVYWVGTIPTARGQGLGEAVTAAVTNRAFDRGATACTLQASEMGEPIYARMGYRTAYRYNGYVRFREP